MKFTDKNYYIDKKLVQKLDMCCDRTSGKNNFDNLLIVDGDEGYGKTNFAMGSAYYVAQKLNRPFSLKNVFFLVDDMINFAINTKEQVIVWDEAAFGGLATEWYRSTQQKLLKLLMVARKKKHFFFFLIPKFFKLNEYIVVDRAIGLIHIYARKETELGRFVYFRKKAKENLFYDWRRKRRRSYKKHYNFRGTFPKVLSKIIDEDEYDKMKDAAINTIKYDESVRGNKMKLFKLQYKIYQAASKFEGTQAEYCEKLGIVYRTLQEWRGLPQKYPEILVK